MQKNGIDLLTLKSFNKRIIWNMTYRCNFHCRYCFFDDKNKMVSDEIVSKLNASQIAEAFENTNAEWLILLSGGEPFLIPDFLEIVKLLSAKTIYKLQRI